ncbi:MAG: ATP-binding protein [Chloroflexi bacterium]|nr:ATP-binding protein [Chloroflexota bacterium]
MNDAQLFARLSEKCTWWRDPAGWERDDPDLKAVRAVSIVYEPAPLADIRPNGLYLLLGPRRVGKSVELKRAIAAAVSGAANPRSILYFSCDGLRGVDLRRMLHLGRSRFPAIAGPRHWFIDEITAIDDWHAIVKDERDTTAFREDCVVLTGSSSAGIQDGVANLAGRHGEPADAGERLLLPMSFRSFCAVTGADANVPPIPALRPRDVFSDAPPLLEELQVFIPQLADAWENYLHVGGYPKVVSSFMDTGDIAPAFVRDLWNVVRGEAFRSMRTTPPEALAFIERLALSLSGPINLSDLARDVGFTDNEQADARITELVTAFLGFRCYKDNDGRPNMKAQRKFYFTDPLLARLPHLVDPSAVEPVVPNVSEQQMALALHRSIEREMHGAFVGMAEVRYWVNPNSKTEIDFVGSRLGLGFESKYVDTGWRGASRAIAARGVGGVVATRRAFALDEDMLAVPSALLAWLLGS